MSPEIYTDNTNEDAEFDDDFNDKEIFQYYITDQEGAETITECTNDLVYYIEALDLYVWCINFLGVSWSQVLTNVPIIKK